MNVCLRVVKKESIIPSTLESKILENVQIKMKEIYNYPYSSFYFFTIPSSNCHLFSKHLS